VIWLPESAAVSNRQAAFDVCTGESYFTGENAACRPEKREVVDYGKITQWYFPQNT
jgi:hypothetical protein